MSRPPAQGPPAMTNGHAPHRAQVIISWPYRAGYALGTLGRAWPVALSLLPALVAIGQRHPHWPGVLLRTLLLGWTGYGWVAALLYTFWTWEARPIAAGHRRMASLTACSSPAMEVPREQTTEPVGFARSTPEFRRT